MGIDTLFIYKATQNISSMTVLSFKEKEALVIELLNKGHMQRNHQNGPYFV